MLSWGCSNSHTIKSVLSWDCFTLTPSSLCWAEAVQTLTLLSLCWAETAPLSYSLVCVNLKLFHYHTIKSVLSWLFHSHTIKSVLSSDCSRSHTIKSVLSWDYSPLTPSSLCWAEAVPLSHNLVYVKLRLFTLSHHQVCINWDCSHSHTIKFVLSCVEIRLFHSHTVKSVLSWGCATHTTKSVLRWDCSTLLNNSPEIPDRKEPSDIPGGTEGGKTCRPP